MVIFNNMAAMSALNETKRHAGSLGKVVKKAASGMKLNSAGDDAAGYSIAARMKVRLRALNQDDENVRKGESLLKIAEGAIQSQMNLLKTVKERVINAHNDTNTDTDRAIIQKEIDQYYDQISSIAYDTDFDGKKLLLGNDIAEKVSSWEVRDTAVLEDDSEIAGLLTDATFATLDGEQGPFATFGAASDNPQYDGYSQSNAFPDGESFSGGTRGTSNTISIIALGNANYGSLAAVDNRAFYLSNGVDRCNFVLTTDMSRNYADSNIVKVDINACSDLPALAAAIANAINTTVPAKDWFTATSNGISIELSTIEDGVRANRYSSGGVGLSGDAIQGYTETKSLNGWRADDIFNHGTGTDGATAHWDIDLSAYNNTNMVSAEQLIQEYVGKAIGVSYNSSVLWEFIDTGSESGMDGVSKVTDNVIDLDQIRTMVGAGTTVAEAFATLVVDKFGSNASVVPAPPATGPITGVSFLADVPGLAGNSQSMVAKTGELRSYTIDWQNWVTSQGITNIAKALDEKGFRFYCATDSDQWINVHFINGHDPAEDARPASGNGALDIKTVTIDIAGINTVEALVNKIDNDLGDYLRNTYQHNFQVASDAAHGTTTIYDQRKYTVLNDPAYPNAQQKGAKIATGIVDTVVKDIRKVYVNNLVIQHTDEASVNVNVKIPQTTLGHIFGYKEGVRSISEYNVMTSEMREMLLGEPPEKGILDRGIEYLTDAQTLIGAQINHMRFADENIVTQNENLSSAASVIQDADMARISMDYARYNILQQASQSMLAQANQTPNGVLSLLQ